MIVRKQTDFEANKIYKIWIIDIQII
jgi:hypothetical protein